MDGFIKRFNCYGGNRSASIDTRTRAAATLWSLGSEEAPEYLKKLPRTRVDVVAVGDAPIQNSGNGTEALAGQEGGILNIARLDGADERRTGKERAVSTAGLAISKGGG